MGSLVEFSEYLAQICARVCSGLNYYFPAFMSSTGFQKKKITVLYKDLRTFPAKYMREILLLLFYFVIVNILVGFENPLFCGYF